MRIQMVLLALLTFTWPTLSQAFEPVNEVHAMLYYQISFGGKHGAKQTGSHRHGFGLRLDKASYQPGQMIEQYALFNKPAVVDLRFSHQGAESFTVAGMDYLNLYRRHNASEAGVSEEDGKIAAATGDATAEEEEGTEDDEGRKPNPAAKFARDFADTLGGVLDRAPKGVIIGVGIAVGLLAGVGD